MKKGREDILTKRKGDCYFFEIKDSQLLTVTVVVRKCHDLYCYWQRGRQEFAGGVEMSVNDKIK